MAEGTEQLIKLSLVFIYYCVLLSPFLFYFNVPFDTWTVLSSSLGDDTSYNLYAVQLQ